MQPADWVLTGEGEETTVEEGGDDHISFIVPAGDYALSEKVDDEHQDDPLLSYYHAGDWVCTDGGGRRRDRHRRGRQPDRVHDREPGRRVRRRHRQELHPARGRGCDRRRHRVHLHARGAQLQRRRDHRRRRDRRRRSSARSRRHRRRHRGRSRGRLDGRTRGQRPHRHGRRPLRRRRSRGRHAHRDDHRPGADASARSDPDARARRAERPPRAAAARRRHGQRAERGVRRDGRARLEPPENDCADVEVPTKKINRTRTCDASPISRGCSTRSRSPSRRRSTVRSP